MYTANPTMKNCEMLAKQDNFAVLGCTTMISIVISSRSIP